MTNIWPPELPKPTGYSSYEFSKHDQSANCHRDYRISYRPGLWSAHCLQRTWGRHGSKNQRSLDQEFEDQATALAALERSINRRLRRGYLIIRYSI
jgi:predicted DNA-binding WGR domain protein